MTPKWQLVVGILFCHGLGQGKLHPVSDCTIKKRCGKIYSISTILLPIIVKQDSKYCLNVHKGNNSWLLLFAKYFLIFHTHAATLNFQICVKLILKLVNFLLG